MIRPTAPTDTPLLLELARGTGVFKPHEITALDEVLRDYHAANQALCHRAITFARDEQVVGFAYYAPAAMTDRAWYLYWIAVDKQAQHAGLGGQLLAEVERHVRALDGRLLLVETSSQPSYELTRKFYLKHGYRQDARVTDFYADGDSLIVFCKRLQE